MREYGAVLIAPRRRGPDATFLVIVESSAGVFEFVAGQSADAVIELTSDGVYEVTESPGSGARAHAVLVRTDRSIRIVGGQ